MVPPYDVTHQGGRGVVHTAAWPGTGRCCCCCCHCCCNCRMPPSCLLSRQQPVQQLFGGGELVWTMMDSEVRRIKISGALPSVSCQAVVEELRLERINCPADKPGPLLLPPTPGSKHTAERMGRACISSDGLTWQGVAGGSAPPPNATECIRQQSASGNLLTCWQEVLRLLH